MKTIVLCLALALFSGVAMSYSCEDYRKYLWEAMSVRQFMVNTYTNRIAWPTIEQHIAALEVQLNICENRTRPEMESCELARRKSEKAREAVMITLFRGRPYKSRDALDISYLTTNQENLAKWRTEAAAYCPKNESCRDAKMSYESSWSSLRGWRGAKEFDQYMISGMELEAQTYKNIIVSTCPAEEVCEFLLKDVNRTTEAITYEMNQTNINYAAVQKLGITYRNATDVIILTCNATHVCPHVESEITAAEESLRSMVRSINPNQRVIEESHSYISRMKRVHNDKCASHSEPKVRLAEFAGRFLSKLIRH